MRSLIIVGPDDSGSEQLKTVLQNPFGRAHHCSGVRGQRRLSGCIGVQQRSFFLLCLRDSGSRFWKRWPVGTPVVTSNVSSMPEVAGEAALLVDPTDTQAIANAMRRIVVEPELRRSLCLAGRARAGQFSWSRTADRVIVSVRRAVQV